MTTEHDSGGYPVALSGEEVEAIYSAMQDNPEPFRLQ